MPETDAVALSLLRQAVHLHDVRLGLLRQSAADLRAEAQEVPAVVGDGRVLADQELDVCFGWRGHDMDVAAGFAFVQGTEDLLDEEGVLFIVGFGRLEAGVDVEAAGLFHFWRGSFG